MTLMIMAGWLTSTSSCFIIIFALFQSLFCVIILSYTVHIISGYIQERTLFQSNTLLPHLRRRINDDVSYIPPPYRILKNMLMGPGMLSGYSFYRSRTDDSAGEHSIYFTQKYFSILLICPWTVGKSICLLFLELGKEAKLSVEMISQSCICPPHGQWPAPMGSWRVLYRTTSQALIELL